MIFRKDSLLFYQSEIIYIIISVLCLTIIPILGLGLSLMYMFPFVVLILINPKLYNEYITMNATGISCQKSGKQLWAYEWDSIVELKRSSRYLLPSVEIIVYDKNGKPEQFARTNHYFQLGRTAKEAIKRYSGDKGTVLYLDCKRRRTDSRP